MGMGIGDWGLGIGDWPSGRRKATVTGSPSTTPTDTTVTARLLSRSRTTTPTVSAREPLPSRPSPPTKVTPWPRRKSSSNSPTRSSRCAGLWTMTNSAPGSPTGPIRRSIRPMSVPCSMPRPV